MFCLYRDCQKESVSQFFQLGIIHHALGEVNAAALLHLLYKFNLTIRLRNVDELAAADENALYAAIPNPMWQAAADWSGHALSA